MEARTHAEVTTGTDPDHEIVADLALAAGSSARWSVGAGDGRVTWSAGLGAMFGLPEEAEADIRRTLLELISPIDVTLRNAPPWDNFELEQSLETPEGEVRWIRFLARPRPGGTKAALLGIATDVTERHGSEQALADLADRYRLLVELSPDAVCVHEGGKLVYVNPAALRFAAVDSADELLGRPITDFVDPASVPAMLHRIEGLTTPGATSEPTEVQLKRFDGDSMLVESVSVRTTWQGRPAFQVIMRDITAQKAAEAALHYQAALVSHVSDAIIATTADGIVTSWNPAAEAVYGRSSTEAIGRDVGELVGAPLDPERVMAAGGVVEADHRTADGSTLAIRVSAAEMHDGYVLVCADETPRRRAERRYSTVVAALDEGVVVIGPDGMIESANPAAARILGMPNTVLRKSSPTRFPLYGESGARLAATEYPFSEVLATGQAQNGRVLRLQRPDGTYVWLSMSCRPLDPDATPPSTVVTSFTDITERRAIGEQLEHDATHDPLTGLANRTLVLQRLDGALAEPDREGLACVLFIDLDKFKLINDSLGHSTGDQVLRVVGQRLRHCVRATDLVGRLGGDEFAVVTFDVSGDTGIRSLIGHLRASLTKPIGLDGRQLRVDASVGIVTAAPGDARSAEDLIRDADVAMYEAKTRGRGRYEFFDVELRERVQRQLRLEQDLREAVVDGQLWMAYQPVVDLRTCRTVAVEGLMRWHHPTHGAISPVEFIPLAEESDLINLIGDYMLRTTTEEIASQRAARNLDTRLTVNLSARQLDDAALVPTVEEALRRTGLPPQTLCLEITESALMRDPEVAGGALSALRGLGVRLAIDDFGTGYSSLAQLWRLPLDTLKIDQSFVAGIGRPGKSEAEAIIRGIVTMAHSMGLTVIAEGVETDRQLEVLRELNCDQAQGYRFGRPVSAGELFPRMAG
ncbi:histidine kinase [Prauserella sp. PE36]|uniref:sensor domain-containing protein n=1 Tax=Prauserella sp. PE36 TaxID=1504709 RepID=UPI000DE3291B|nr:EAL domain-containing protein [Prauserella sp. PE36]RBM20530.1 histidine kinase [Prauserella sp. PE36]